MFKYNDNNINGCNNVVIGKKNEFIGNANKVNGSSNYILGKENLIIRGN